MKKSILSFCLKKLGDENEKCLIVYCRNSFRGLISPNHMGESPVKISVRNGYEPKSSSTMLEPVSM